METLMEIAAVVAGSFLVNVVYMIARTGYYVRHGPSKREFVRSVEIIRAFIDHHNRQHPLAVIKSLTISLSEITDESHTRS